MQTNQLYPWLNSYWQQIQSLKSQSRLPHALMLRGDKGLGIDSLAMEIGKSMLCKNPTVEGFACGNCSDCKLIAASTHPDLHNITIAEDKKLIVVDQIRSLVSVCIERPHQGGYRVAIITPCNAMNAAAANALLKTLEEPGDDTLIILVANTTNTLPATVRSRCQLMAIYSPAEEVALNYLLEHSTENKDNSLLALRLSNHAPLQALTLFSSKQLETRKNLLASMESAVKGLLDPTKLVASINKFDFAMSIDWMYSLALDAQKLSHSIAISQLINFDQEHLLEKLSHCNTQKLNNWIDKLTEARRLLATTSNINPQLIVEDLMFRWIAIFK
ncbi:MAG: DNA polymerase-3 subunit delta' [Enterobacterales bacterium]|jgi:DNA polymerase-3 subunit delta'